MLGGSRTPLTAALTAAVALALAAGVPAARAAGGGPQFAPAVKSDVSPPLRSIRPLPPGNGVAHPARRRFGQTFGDIASSPFDRGRQTATGSGPAALSSPTGWDGVSNINTAVPPDTNGDVGPNDFVQWVNVSFQIWNKQGQALTQPMAGNTLWSGFGGLCETTNQGDPVVVYDRQADRWVFTQFAFALRGSHEVPPYYQCVAVSTTGDPTGSYYRYAFLMNATSVTSAADFPDYPKLGVWPDGYYLTTNNFGANSFDGPGVYAMDRTKMLSGDPSAGMISFANTLGPQYEGLLPANMSGATPPPAGSPNYVAGVDTDNSATAQGSTFQLWKFHADFATPANSTLTGPTNLAVNPYKFGFCGQAYSSSCVPQPGTTQKLDPLSDRLMNRLQYRNFGDHESLVASHTVNVGSGANDQAGVRWYEIRSPRSSPVVAQQGTFAPADGVNRWMGSAAMDGAGDIALGYSVSNGSTVSPGVRYTGRQGGDQPGLMTQPERTMVTGAGSQTGYDRWGDYSAMSVDPSDDQAFWYTQEYYSATSSEGWRTTIGHFKFVPAPHVTLTAPADGSFTNDTTPTFGGTADLGATALPTITVKVYSGADTNGALVQTLAAARGTDGSWSVTPTTALAPGTYTAQAQQADSDGNIGASSANTFTVDTTAPAAPAITAPANNSYNNTGAFSVSGNAEANSTVEVFDGGTASQGTTTADGSGHWSKALTSVSNGDHTYTAKATDAAGNTSVASAGVTVHVDTTPPAAPSIASPTTGSYKNTSSFSVSGNAEANSTVELFDGATSKGTTTASGGSWSKSVTAAADGDHTYTAKATDAAGNTSLASSSVTVHVDTVAPAVTLSTPASGVTTSNPTPALTGTAGSAAGDSATVTVDVYSGASASGTPVEAPTATRQADGSWSTAASPPLANGTYTAQATQADAAGNTGASAPHTFTVSTTHVDQPPVAAFTFSPASPLTGQSVLFDGSGSSDPDGTVSAWSWSFGDGSGASGAKPTHAYAAAGAYAVQLTVTDDSGSTGVVGQSVGVTAPPPATTPPVVPVPPVVPAFVRLKAALGVPRQSLGTVLRRGLLTYLYANKPARFELRLTLDRRVARTLHIAVATVTVGRVVRTAASAGSVIKVRVRLSRKTIARLRRVRSVRSLLTLTARDALGESVVLRQRLTLRR